MLEALAALVKLLLYAGLLSGAGAAFAAASLGRRLGPVRPQSLRIMRAGAMLGLLASLATVIILIQRLGGQYDAPTLAAVFQGPTALAAGLQIVGSLLLLLATLIPGWTGWVGVIGGLAAIGSFGVNGHGAAAGAVEGLVALVHVSAAAWWLGSLWLLRPACAHLPLPDLAALVRSFSSTALIIVGALVIAGGVLILSLVQLDRQPLLTPYGQILAVKLGLAAFLLTLAGFNKLRLTPRLVAGDASAATALRCMIGIELGVIGSILAATALLTTYTSPHA